LQWVFFYKILNLLLNLKEKTQQLDKMYLEESKFDDEDQA